MNSENRNFDSKAGKNLGLESSKFLNNVSLFPIHQGKSIPVSNIADSIKCLTKV